MDFSFKKLILVSVPILLIQLAGCGKEVKERPETIATVGDRIIDWDYLKRDFQLNPKWGRGLTYQQAYSNQLNYLIDQKLFALAAISEGIDKDEAIEDHLNFIYEKEMIKELYRQVVAKKIEIADKEYEDAYAKLKKQVQLNYIFTPDYGQARKYSQRLSTSEFGEILLTNLQSEFKGTTEMMSFGDMQPELEKVVFELGQNEVSQPISIKDGYIVVQVANGNQEKFTSEFDFAESKSKIKKVIYHRKANKIANSYIKSLMLDKDLKLNSATFFDLSDQFSQIIQDKYSNNPFPININDQEIKTAQRDLASIKDEVLITHQDGEMTVGEFLSKLARMPTGLRPKVKMANQIKDAIGIIVRNEYLAKEAKKKGLDNNENVRRETEIQSDEILARQWLKVQKESVNVSEEELSQFEGSERYDQLLSEISGKPTQDQVKDVLLDLKMARLKINLIDSLRHQFNIQIDTTRLESKIKNSTKVIKYNPARMAVRELFY